MVEKCKEESTMVKLMCNEYEKSLHLEQIEEGNASVWEARVMGQMLYDLH